MASFDRRNDCKSSCTIYVVLIAIVFTSSMGIDTYSIYNEYMNRDKKLRLNIIMSIMSYIKLLTYLLKIDINSYKNVDVYYTGYITLKDYVYVRINSVNPLYLIVSEVDGYIKEKNGSKYLIFNSVNENNKVLKKFNELCDGIKNEIETINSGKTSEYYKNFMKIKFNSDDNLPLNKPLKLHNIIIVSRSVFEEHGKFYSEVYLDECLYDLLMLEYNRIDVSEGIDTNKTNTSNEFKICHYWYFKDIGFKYEPYLCNGCHVFMQKAISFHDVAILYAKGSTYKIHFWYMSKDDAISIMNNSNFIDKMGVL